MFLALSEIHFPPGARHDVLCLSFLLTRVVGMKVHHLDLMRQVFLAVRALAFS